ncbi:MAG: hypothetical protein JRN24_00275 [Nitrososphaerota archaeon]|nr:hypothetical protein [Nitrososphaerota archaeon]
MLEEAGRRAEARGAYHLEALDVGLPATPPRHVADAEGFDIALLEVLRGTRGAFSVGELRRRVAARCEEAGIRVQMPARLWRRLISLERKGVDRREVRMGGAGGSSTLVSLEASYVGGPNGGRL